MALRRTNEALELEAEACRAAALAAQLSGHSTLFDTLESFPSPQPGLGDTQEFAPSPAAQVFPDDWNSPPAKFSKRGGKSSRRSSALFAGGKPPGQASLMTRVALAALHIDEAGENDCDSADDDNDTVADEEEQQQPDEQECEFDLAPV